MHSLQYRILIMGCASMLLAILFGVFGAHVVKSEISMEKFEVFQTANLYHLLHSLALLVLIPLDKKIKSLSLNITRFAFLFGVIFFSGSLYVVALNDLFPFFKAEWFRYLAPLGGISFMVGWISLLLGSAKGLKSYISEE